MARYKLVYCTTLHGHRPHLQLARHPYPWICQIPEVTRIDRSPTFGRTQRASIHAIRSILQINALKALINMPHPPPPPFSPSSTLSTSLTYLPPSPPSSPLTHNISHTVAHLYAPPPFSPINDVHLPTHHPPPQFPVQ